MNHQTQDLWKNTWDYMKSQGYQLTWKSQGPNTTKIHAISYWIKSKDGIDSIMVQTFKNGDLVLFRSVKTITTHDPEEPK